MAKMSETTAAHKPQEEVLAELAAHIEALPEYERIVQAGMICATVLRPVARIAEDPISARSHQKPLNNLRLQLGAIADTFRHQHE